jgi:hypothetical protein
LPSASPFFITPTALTAALKASVTSIMYILLC